MWVQRIESRALEHGGYLRLHAPCMRAFCKQAIFAEEGSKGVADSYRQRRIQAVALCRWLAMLGGRPRVEGPRAARAMATDAVIECQ